MPHRKNPSPGQRRVWRITQQAPLGEVVDPDLPAPKAPDPPAREETSDAGWRESSYDLLNGLDVTETEEGEFEDLFKKGATPDSDAQRQVAPSVISKHQWLLRFALKCAELDGRAQPKPVIQLARALWPTKGHLLPEAVAEAAHGDGQKKSP